MTARRNIQLACAMLCCLLLSCWAAQPTADAAVDAAAGSIPPCPAAPASVPLPTPLPEVLQSALDAFAAGMNGIMAGGDGLSMHVTVVHDQRTLLSQGYGLTSVTGGHVPDEDTQYRVGSLSKVITDTLLLTAESSGAVSRRDPFTSLAPGYAPKDPFETTSRGASLADMGSHMAGLPKSAPCSELINCNITLQQATERVSEWTLLQAPGTMPHYSNLGFSLLGQGLAAHLGETFEAATSRMVFKPLNMTRSAWAAEVSDGNVAEAYFAGSLAPLNNIGFSSPAGGLVTTGRDMSQVMKLLFRDHEAKGSSPAQILDGSTIRQWLTDVVYQNPGNVPQPFGLLGDAWGMPWERYAVNAATAAPFSSFYMPTKDGAINGYQAFIAVIPQLKLGLFASLAMNSTAGTSFPTFVVPLAEAFAFKLAPAAVQALMQVQPRPSLPTNVQEYIGAYTFNGVELVITLNSSIPALFVRQEVTQPEAWLQTSHPAIQLRYLGSDSFQPLLVPHTCWFEEAGELANFRFIRGDSGAVSGVTLPGRAPWGVVFMKSNKVF